jgi:hypothetical protein
VAVIGSARGAYATGTLEGHTEIKHVISVDIVSVREELRRRPLVRV